MWIFSTNGFASVVAHRHESEILLVRFRDREDAAAFARRVKAAANLPRTPRVWRDDAADYLWRMRVTRTNFALTVADMVAAIDYPNFKSVMASRCPRWDYASLSQVWHTTHHHQVLADRARRPTRELKFNFPPVGDDDEIVDPPPF